MSKLNIVWIVAGNIDEYATWIKQKMLEGKADNYQYVHNVDRLRGLTECHGFFIGTYKQRSDYYEIRDQIKLINSRTQPTMYGKTISGVVLDEVANAPQEMEMKVDPNTGDIMCYHRGNWITAVKGTSINHYE